MATPHDVLSTDKMFPVWNFSVLKCGCEEPAFKVVHPKGQDKPDSISQRALEMERVPVDDEQPVIKGSETDDPLNMYAC